MLRFFRSLQSHLESDVENPLRRVLQSRTSALLRIPQLEPREGQQIRPTDVETHLLVGIADLGILQFQERSVPKPVGRGCRIVAILLDAQSRISRMNIRIALVPLGMRFIEC